MCNYALQMILNSDTNFGAFEPRHASQAEEKEVKEQAD